MESVNAPFVVGSEPGLCWKSSGFGIEELLV